MLTWQKKNRRSHTKNPCAPFLSRTCAHVFTAQIATNRHRVATWLHLYKPLISLRGEFAIFAGRWRKTGTIIFFDIRPTPSAHREPPLGEISGIIMELDFFRFLTPLHFFCLSDILGTRLNTHVVLPYEYEPKLHITTLATYKHARW